MSFELTIWFSWSRILSFVDLILRLTDFSPGLASSAISSSEMMQRMISLQITESGSSSSNLSVSESGSAPSSVLPYDLTRSTAVSTELICSSSPAPRHELTSSLMIEGLMSCIPENDSEPLR